MKDQDQLLTEITQAMNYASDLSREEYRALLEEIIGDAQDRLDALYDDEQEKED